MTTTAFASLPASERPAIITGASSGIGEASARALAALGHPVVLGARRIETTERIADELRRAGNTAHAFALDLSDEDSVNAFAAHADRAVGPVNVLVSNAGVSQPGTVLAGDRASFEQAVNVNVLGTRSLVQLVGTSMVERGCGDLVFVTSEVTRAPRPGMSPYLTSKWAAEGMVQALGLELEGTGVRVSTIRPGATLTEMGWDWKPEVVGPLYADWERRGLQRHDNFMTPADVAAAVVAVVGAPPGVVFRVVEIEPLAPIPPKLP